MNHGSCEKCFWYEAGWCYMEGCAVKANSYCPDYINRKYEKDDLHDTLAYKQGRVQGHSFS